MAYLTRDGLGLGDSGAPRMGRGCAQATGQARRTPLRPKTSRDVTTYPPAVPFTTANFRNACAAVSSRLYLRTTIRRASPGEPLVFSPLTCTRSPVRSGNRITQWARCGPGCRASKGRSRPFPEPPGQKHGRLDFTDQYVYVLVCTNEGHRIPSTSSPCFSIAGHRLGPFC